MATVASEPMTVEAFYEWASRPGNAERRYELEKGDVVEMPPPSEVHGVICWLIGRILGNYLFTRGDGYVGSNDTGLVLHRSPITVRAPDLMVLLQGKPLSSMSRRHAEAMPDLVVEIISPTDRSLAVLRRAQQYLQAGVRMAWVVSPEDQTVAVCERADEFPQVLDAADELTGLGVLPEFRCRVADLFALPGEAAKSQG